jgi:hypothetical protein
MPPNQQNPQQLPPNQSPQGYQQMPGQLPQPGYPQQPGPPLPNGPPAYQQPASANYQPPLTAQQQQFAQAQQTMPPAAMTAVQRNPNSTQNSLDVAEIRDGIVIMADGSYRSVILAQSINFDLMSPQEREAVEFSYQSFLNSLYFPIQILIRSQKVDLRPYIQKLDKLHSEQDNMLLAYLMEDYINYIQILAQETNIMDKQFYIVVPYFKEADAQQALKAGTGLLGSLFKPKTSVITINEGDLEAAKTELRNRVQSVLNGLIQMGVQGIPLDTQELIELFYDVYNPDTATHQKVPTRQDFSAPIVRKGEGMANQPHLDSELQ